MSGRSRASGKGARGAVHRGGLSALRRGQRALSPSRRAASRRKASDHAAARLARAAAVPRRARLSVTAVRLSPAPRMVFAQWFPVSATAQPKGHVFPTLLQPSSAGCFGERIVSADVDPDGYAVDAARSCRAEDVVAREVLGVVERAGRRLAAAGPECRRVCTDRAEPPRPQPPDVERAEAAHRDAADRDAQGVGVCALQGRGDRLSRHRRSPRAVMPVAPVAVLAAVGRAARPALASRVREARRRTAAAVRGGDEPRPCKKTRTAAAAVGHDEDLLEVAMDETAVEREARDGRAARAAVAAHDVAQTDPGQAADRKEGCEDDRPAHRARAYRRPRYVSERRNASSAA